jgi:hypothetical protein
MDRVVVNACSPLGHNPGGSRCWWRLHGGSDEQLYDAHLMRMAGGVRLSLRPAAGASAWSRSPSRARRSASRSASRATPKNALIVRHLILPDRRPDRRVALAQISADGILGRTGPRGNLGAIWALVRPAASMAGQLALPGHGVRQWCGRYSASCVTSARKDVEMSWTLLDGAAETSAG